MLTFFCNCVLHLSICSFLYSKKVVKIWFLNNNIVLNTTGGLDNKTVLENIYMGLRNCSLNILQGVKASLS